MNHAESMNEISGSASVEDGTARPSYRFHILVLKEEDGTFSVIALNLPGVGSIGATAEEAEANFREAAAGALDSYATSGEAIPWKDSKGENPPPGAKSKWILIYA